MDAAVLRHHAFVQGLSESDLAALGGVADEVVFDENAMILRGGQRAPAIYLIVSGSVAIELRTATITSCVQVLAAGDMCGWSALLENQDTVFQVRARERVAAVRLDGAGLQAICRTHPALGVELLRRTLQIVAGRVRATEERFAEMCGVRMRPVGAL